MGLNEKIAYDESIPNWFRILNIEDTCFERSKYAGLSGEKFRLKDLGLLRRLFPGIYAAAAEEVKEYNDYLAENEGGKFRKTKLGKKIGSIPMMDATLHPELMSDPKAQDKYWREHSEYKCKR